MLTSTCTPDSICGKCTGSIEADSVWTSFYLGEIELYDHEHVSLQLPAFLSQHFLWA